MSLSSLQDRMEQRAAQMAQMAKRASNPQDIIAMQQRLTAEIQNGTIKSYIGIPLIQELTKRLGEAKAKAAMGVMGAPAQGGAPAAPIAQQVMQQAAQDSQGVEALPSNLPQDYAGGGIIAFEGGGNVQRFETGDLVDERFKAAAQNRRTDSAAEQASPKAPPPPDPKSLQNMVKQYQDMMTAIPKGASQTEYEEYLKNKSKTSEANRKENLLMAAAQFGLNLAGAKGPNFGQNLGEAGIKTLPAVQEAFKQRRLEDEGALRGRAELDRMSRAEQMEALKGGVGLYGTERQIQAEADKAEANRQNNLRVAEIQNQFKPTDITNFVNDYVANARKTGDNRPVESIKIEGYNKYPGYVYRQNIAGMQTGAVLSGQDVTSQGQALRANTEAMVAWNKLQESRTTERKEYKDAMAKDAENAAKGNPTNLAEEYKKKWFRDTHGLIYTPTVAAKPAVTQQAAPAAAPSSRLNALPPGAVYKGTSGGKKVYQTPDGKQYIQD